MLKTSHLISFLNNEKNILIHFLEGQKLIQDLALTHPLAGQGLFYFRTAVLTIQPMVSLLKPGESLGFYIDSDDPFFILKLETNDQGHVRTLLLPENFNQFPEKITGKSRLIKKIKNTAPYNSVIELKGVSFKEVMNQVLKISYQMKAEIWVGDKTDQCMMMTRLPDSVLAIESDQLAQLDFENYLKEYKEDLLRILNTDITSIEQLQNLLTPYGFKQIHTRPIHLRCSCSKENMMLNLYYLITTSSDPDSRDLFSTTSPDSTPSLTINCDFCKTKYEITEVEFKDFLNKETITR